MGQLVPPGLRAAKPPKAKCQAIIEDYANGTHYNLARPFTAPEHRQCSRYARSKLGKLCLCALHTKLALEGLVEENGAVASRSAIADVRRNRNPHKFVNGLYDWARNLKAEDLP